MASDTAVYGLFKERHNVETATATLIQYGFQNTDISVLFPQKIVPQKANPVRTERSLTQIPAWLAGIGALAIRGVRPFIGSGPVMALLDGIGVGRTTGTLARALIGMGMPEPEAKRYEGRIRAGCILFFIRCEGPEWATRAKDLLKHTGAEDIASAAMATTAFVPANNLSLQTAERGI